jgi:hypothetical protein
MLVMPRVSRIGCGFRHAEDSWRMVNSRQRYPASPRRPFAHRGTAEAALSCDLIWMDFEQLRQLSQGSVDFDGGQRHLRLESRGVVPACRLLIVSPDSRANLARRQALHLSHR